DLIADLKGAIANEIAVALLNPNVRPIARLILSLPLTVDLPVLDSTNAALLANHLDAALAHGAAAFIKEVLNTGDLSELGLTQAMKRGLDAAKTKLDDPVTWQGTTAQKDQAEEALKAYRDAAKDYADNVKKDFEQQVAGVFHPYLFGKNGIFPELAGVAG